MKIKKHYKNLFSSPYEPIIIQKLYSEISKLLSENLNLNLREAKLESRFILEQTLKVKHQYLIKNSNQLIETNKFKQIMSYVVQRLSYKPLAYIFKEWKFYDMKFFLTNNVLIPRQDTELVIDLILEKYHRQKNIDILDLGAGSGVIGIVLANKFKNANVLLSDISSDAIDIAKKNILFHKLKNISTIKSDWFTNITNKKFDLIISNPPYINKSDSHLKNKELLFEPKNALISGQEGYADIIKIIKLSPKFLNSNGALYIEHGYNQSKKIKELFLKNNFIKIKQKKDLNGIIRITSGEIKI
jgi:release factor glutamine methyltransferase